MMALLRAAKILLLLGLFGFAGLLLYGYARNHPQDLPWTSLDLSQPVGAFTGRKLAALGEEPGQCRALIASAGVRFTTLPALSGGPSCGYTDALRFRTQGSLDIAYRPAGLGVSCPVAAALA